MRRKANSSDDKQHGSSIQMQTAYAKRFVVFGLMWSATVSQ
jgi:hypothetical protein